MLDNGRGDPDVTLFDGIYSGYFAGFLEKGDYEIRVTINANEGRAKFMTHYRSSSVIDFCCGSVIMGVGNHVPAFWMDKLIVYTAKNKRPEDGYPPSRILDLQARIFKSADTVTLTWTAPGGGKAVRYVLKLFESREDAVTKFETTGRALNARRMVPGDIGGKERLEIPFKDLDEDVTYYAATRSRNEFNKSSEISNVAEFVPTQEETTASSTPASTTASGNTTDGGIAKPDQTKNDNETIGIVLGILGGIAALCILVYLGYYFFVKKPRRN
ncbi:hypothetical protein AVEN_7426-1 [Araneus ventricosus]|uniref:Fibronectin type-III domain-containing protein n=1 Tax=Araneus ventricosus TaxID=182803 RepID=A0A4Y2H0S9_ARAVE|nr:hypothetical protein AVEN_7426-1 [Araneus ventricosus]